MGVEVEVDEVDGGKEVLPNLDETPLRGFGAHSAREGTTSRRAGRVRPSIHVHPYVL